ncbi:MAG: DUF3800 domain-containing protein [Armatimonadia bacterium]
MRYRLYIDESGDEAVNLARARVEHRYLGLLGIVLRIDDIRPHRNRMEELSVSFFSTDPDDELVFHATEMVSGTGPFGCLKCPAIRGAWDRIFLRFLTETPFDAIPIVVDKFGLDDVAYAAEFGPYAAGVIRLVELYVDLLARRGGSGDIMLEARSSHQDRLVAAGCAEMWHRNVVTNTGIPWRSIISKPDVEFRPKRRRHFGLQIADLCVKPYTRCLLQRAGQAVTPSQFAGSLWEMISGKLPAGIGVDECLLPMPNPENKETDALASVCDATNV